MRGAVRLGHQVHRLALLSQPRNNGPGQVRFSGARQAREQQGVARQAVAHGVVHPVPPPLFGPLRLHARRPAAAQQRLRLFHAVDRRAIRVAQRLQRPQPLREALRQPLREQAVRVHLREVPRRRVQDAPGLGHHAVLKAQHRVVDGAVGAVAQQPPGVNEVPHHRRRPERSPRPRRRVHAELGHVLLALGPRGVHALQRAPQRRRVHVAPRGNAQHDVVPAADAQVQHRGQRNLRVPAGPHVRQQAGLPRVAPPQSPGPAARRPRAQRRPPGTGWAGGRGRWPARCACSAPRPRRRTARPCGGTLRTPAPQKPEEAAWG